MKPAIRTAWLVNPLNQPRMAAIRMIRPRTKSKPMVTHLSPRPLQSTPGSFVGRAEFLESRGEPYGVSMNSARDRPELHCIRQNGTSHDGSAFAPRELEGLPARSYIGINPENAQRNDHPSVVIVPIFKSSGARAWRMLGDVQHPVLGEPDPHPHHGCNRPCIVAAGFHPVHHGRGSGSRRVPDAGRLAGPAGRRGGLGDSGVAAGHRGTDHRPVARLGRAPALHPGNALAPAAPARHPADAAPGEAARPQYPLELE